MNIVKKGGSGPFFEKPLPAVSPLLTAVKLLHNSRAVLVWLEYSTKVFYPASSIPAPTPYHPSFHPSFSSKMFFSFYSYLFSARIIEAKRHTYCLFQFYKVDSFLNQTASSHTSKFIASESHSSTRHQPSMELMLWNDGGSPLQK